MKTTLPYFTLAVSRKYLPVVCLLACFLCNTFMVSGQTVTLGKSYINVSRPNGGTFFPGDTIEVRATIAVNGGSATNRVNSVRYNDTINLTKFKYIDNSLQMLSNEGRLQYQFTDIADGDSANIDLPTGRLRFNVGNSAGAANVNTQGNGITNAGRLWGALRPTFYGATTIRMYVYRVVIKDTASVVDIDSTIRLSAGNFRYRIGSSSTDQLSNFSPYSIRITPDYGLCSNSVGSNAILKEYGGTFGSGTPQNRTAASSVPTPYTFVNFGANAPNDNYYGVANNTSADNTNNPNVPYSTGTGSASRVFKVWDIIGDHTGAADPAAGNPPTNNGYAVIVNASYETNRAFLDTINNLCEETYYEFSAWFRNVCRRCGCDSTGKGATTTGFVPAPGNDSSGVRPNLTFKINNEDLYTTGNIPYTGEWVKKGFVFKTKAGQTSMILTIRNNAPGGGGNDWAIDDIKLATCLPNMAYSPSLNPNVCSGNALTLYDTVRSYFENYTYHQWQESNDGGTTWTNVSTVRDSIPHKNTTLNVWEYVTSYTTPVLTNADSGKRYRLIVATSVDNISNVNCRSTDLLNSVTLNVLNCGPVLGTDLISFTGKLNNNKATLNWTTVGDNKQTLYFDVEKSDDGYSYHVIATVNSKNQSGRNDYSFIDPEYVYNRAYYRIKMKSADGKATYSKVIQLSAASEAFTFTAVINPFNNALSFDIASTNAGSANAELIDQFGRPVKRKALDIREGVMRFSFDNTNRLAAGVYILRVQMGEAVIYRKVVKQNY